MHDGVVHWSMGQSILLKASTISTWVKVIINLQRGRRDHLSPAVRLTGGKSHEALELNSMRRFQPHLATPKHEAI